MNTSFVGGDVAKQKLDVANFSTGKHFVVANMTEGINQLIKSRASSKQNL